MNIRENNQFELQPENFQQGYQQGTYFLDPAIQEKREIRRASIGAALSVVGIYVANIIFIFAFTFSLFMINLEGVLLSSNNIYIQIIDIIVYSTSMFLPFFILGHVYRKKTGITFKTMVGTSKPPLSSFILMIFIGLGASMVGNFATNLLSIIMSLFNITFTAPDFSPPVGLVPQIVFLFHLSVLPAFFEEFAFRGVILARLRKFGDGFAILISAILFGVMHGNFVQAPFAFILGLALGYFYVLTGSIWVSVAIHFFNNLLSGLLMIFTEGLTDNSLIFVNTIYLTTVLLLGLISLGLFLKKHPLAFSLTDTNSVLTLKKRVIAALPGLIIAIGSIVVFAIIGELLRSMT